LQIAGGPQYANRHPQRLGDVRRSGQQEMAFRRLV